MDLREPDYRGAGDVCAFRGPAGQGVRREREQDQCLKSLGFEFHQPTFL